MPLAWAVAGDVRMPAFRASYRASVLPFVLPTLFNAAAYFIIKSPSVNDNGGGGPPVPVSAAI